ncbi:hypothetical protein [Deinococcus pimensis]|uniref:hypothetical protein n=1 Tax=Deinococcus pimensis TaxID=309888 RepID=UPI0004844C17|nr:hypothetical protein [Deinococcus pimensis]
MTRTLLLSALLLAPSLALAGVVPSAPATTVTTSVNVNVNVDFPVVPQTTAAVVGLVALGTTALFLNAGGTVVANLTPSGTVVSVGGYDPATAVNVQVVTREATTVVVREVYPLAVRIKGGKVRPETLTVRGGGKVVPLVAVMKAQNDRAKGRGKGHGNGRGNGKH